MDNKLIKEFKYTFIAMMVILMMGGISVIMYIDKLHVQLNAGTELIEAYEIALGHQPDGITAYKAMSDKSSIITGEHTIISVVDDENDYAFVDSLENGKVYYPAYGFRIYQEQYNEDDVLIIFEDEGKIIISDEPAKDSDVFRFSGSITAKHEYESVEELFANE